MHAVPTWRPEQRPMASLIEFVRKTRNRLDLVWIAIPASFFILTNLRIAILTTPAADKIINLLGTIYPVVVEQYSEVKRLGSEGDETRFALFLALVLLFEVFVTVWTVTGYLEKHETIKTDTQDVLLAFLLVTISIYVLQFDKIKEKPQAYWNFLVDSSGLYYFRQAVTIYVLGMTLSTVLLLVAEATKKFMQLRRG